MQPIERAAFKVALKNSRQPNFSVAGNSLGGKCNMSERSGASFVFYWLRNYVVLSPDPSYKPKAYGGTALMVKHFKNYSYELTPQPSELGGGWLLRMLADNEELGRRIFPPVVDIKDAKSAATLAHDDALARVMAWLASIETRDPCYRPRPADNGGMYLLMPDDELLSLSASDWPANVV
jgi:hypothetical protein